ncbi:MAG: putative glycoside hydrolase [Saccharofermentans sp.]|nr:putative glycoside hydrolase [Saccharofermentans sp.]
MINDNKRYDLNDYKRARKMEGERSKAKVAALQRIFLILLCVSLMLALILIGSIVGKKTATDPDAPLINLKTTTAATASGTMETIPTPTPTVPFTVEEYLPVNQIADNYWGPLIPAENPVPYIHNEIHALYISSAENLDACIELANNSEINAFVIDLKESGVVYFDTTNETALQIGYVYVQYDIDEVVQKCHENNILVIGRIVCFKDPKLAETFPDRAICDSAGNMLYFPTEGSNAFASPYDSRNWDYYISLAEEAIGHGVDEIQFDYVRFPTGSTTSGATPYFGIESEVPSKSEAINRFLQTARIRIQDTLGVPLGADIFGIAVTSSLDGDILGQDWETVGLSGVDSLCPMIYPSHYALGTMLNGAVYETPDKEPYAMMYGVLTNGRKYSDQEGYATVRPYLQAFTAAYIGAGNYMEYDYTAINDQIRGLQDAGFSEFILWNAEVQYPNGNYGGNND